MVTPAGSRGGAGGLCSSLLANCQYSGVTVGHLSEPILEVANGLLNWRNDVREFVLPTLLDQKRLDRALGEVGGFQNCGSLSSVLGSVRNESRLDDPGEVRPNLVLRCQGIRSKEFDIQEQVA